MSSYSWKDIQLAYTLLGRWAQEYDDFRKRIGIPRQINIKHSDNDNIFIGRFWRDVRTIEKQLKALDREIARRNNLIGVMG